uniref:Cytochrome c biogenesis protein CcsA n=1 Tax=Callipsygma wilsonis TaxID=2320807 RepID=A0A386AZW7_9CHLO|nr:cytochrome c biogenesis protein ccs1 [Callipsygma wilsonis]AYC64990.1 cytochrome c biogenesis protein ccs1 [Callipsygma wilsonis]
MFIFTFTLLNDILLDLCFLSHIYFFIYWKMDYYWCKFNNVYFINLSRFYKKSFSINIILYEALIFLSWSLTSIHLIIENYFINFGALIAPTALFLNAFASFQIPESLKEFNSLIPALQSNWLMMHVTVMLFSYATLISGCLFSIAFLNISETNSNILNKLDQLSFRTIGIGFPLLTIGILSGSVWANEAWGSYWSWDPKETWSLITWIIFAIYLHLRLTKNWNGKKSAILGTFGFFIIWICFLGVNFIGKGLHSYGWLK